MQIVSEYFNDIKDKIHALGCINYKFLKSQQYNNITFAVFFIITFKRNINIRKWHKLILNQKINLMQI